MMPHKSLKWPQKKPNVIVQDHVNKMLSREIGLPTLKRSIEDSSWSNMLLSHSADKAATPQQVKPSSLAVDKSGGYGDPMKKQLPGNPAQ
jgi:hypothetical protein